MANQSDRLVKIGLEGFALIDEIYGPSRTRRLPATVAPEPQPHQAYLVASEGLNKQLRPHGLKVFNKSVTQVTHMKETTMVLNSHEAARKYGGIVYYYHYHDGHGGNGKPLVAFCEAKMPVPSGPDAFRGSRLGKHDVADPLAKIFNVLQFGAKPNGRSDNTQAFMKTWIAACHHKGKARVVIPQGVFKLGPVVFAGPCTATSPLVVQVSGTLKADTDISLYDSAVWFSFEDISGIVITGSGNFDGQGKIAWKYNDCKSNSDCVQLPASIKFDKVSNGVIKGITSTDSQGFHMSITQCQNIRVRHIHISAPDNSPNTDGIHISNSNNVRISKVVIGTGDDCIGMIKGSTNIAINKVTCGPGHGISVGSLGKYENEEDVYGITVKNCTFIGTENGIRIKSWPAGKTPSKASSMIYDDILMQNVRNPILIDQQYCPSGCGNTKPSLVKISNVHFINVRGTTITPDAVKFMCSPKYPCDNIHLHNINLKSTAPKPLGAELAPEPAAFDSPEPATSPPLGSAEHPGSPLATLEGSFDVTQYGAVADGKTDSSLAFLAAWDDACAHTGNPTLFIPNGTFYVGPVSFTGPCHNQQSLKVEIMGTLEAPSSFDDKSPDWVVFKNLHGIILSGGTRSNSNFDGQGAEAWSIAKCRKEGKCKIFPTSLKFSNVTNGTISNIALINSKAFHVGLHGCDNIVVSNISISAPWNSPNTDGIHVSLSSNISITYSTIGVGDDCVSIGPGSINISISNVNCGPGHGISVGSLGKTSNEKDVIGVSAQNCTINGTQNGIRVKTWPGSPASKATNLKFENIVMVNVSNPIIIDQEYCPSDTCNNTEPSLVKLTDIQIKNISGTYNSEFAVTLLCSSVAPCENLTLADISLSNTKPDSSQTGRFSVNGGLHGLDVLNSSF
ncbi:hypothetical protein FNV43_RR00923 [Rhamnella rubrinervis]|uniref:Uncharacterized protein n=1 Tax=Rhamnella rubrinervis TaxID=2594499 RepID=A0A8K0HQH5_9ROSA|nr:hypothetical protein FNV43_RR00923 [Rhamnella rubrinervis]